MYFYGFVSAFDNFAYEFRVIEKFCFTAFGEDVIYDFVFGGGGDCDKIKFAFSAFVNDIELFADKFVRSDSEARTAPLKKGWV